MRKIKIATVVIMTVCFAACSSNEIRKPTILQASANTILVPVEIPLSVAELNNSAVNISSICPDDMQHISGMFCTNVIQKCLRYMDPPSNKFARCAEFAPTICVGKKIHMDFCIDTEEHHPPDSDMPSNDMTFGNAAQECFQEGKKLCQENQWTFACEGEQMFPHTTGYTRPSDVCNFDKTHLVVDNKFVDQSASINDNPQCISPFGVHNMNGNVDEWVSLEYPYTPKNGSQMWSGLKGGWWGGVRDRCRPITAGHGGSYHDVQIGFRCCEETQ